MAETLTVKMFDFKKTLVLLFILLCHSLHVLLHHIHELPLTSSFPSFLPIFTCPNAHPELCL